MANLNHPKLFTSVELTGAVNKLPVPPLRFGRLFESKGVRTTSVSFDVKNGRLVLVEHQDRSAPPKHRQREKPQNKILECAHLPLIGTVKPEDIQDVRGFGTDEPVTAVTVINDTMQTLKNDVEMTVEYHRLGAIKGRVMDADGVTVLHDLYKVFGVTQKKLPITFPADVPVKENPILKAILDGKRHIEQKANGLPISHIEAVVGSEFYDALTGHELVRELFEQWLANQASFGNNDFRKRGFPYGGVVFMEVNDVVDGKNLVAPDKAHMYPVATPGFSPFKTFHAPANWMSTVNTVGRPFYAQQIELDGDRGFDIEVQSNPLCICTYPETLVEFTAQ